MSQPSITFWNRVEPSPRTESMKPGLTAAVRDPLWFLTRQWQFGEFQGEDAASPAFVNVAVRSGRLNGWRSGDEPLQPYDGRAPLESLAEREAFSPDIRTAVELGQALERRLTSAGLSADVVDAFRLAFPVPFVSTLNDEQSRDKELVRLLRVCAGRAVDGIAAWRAATATASGLPPQVNLPAGTNTGTVAGVLDSFLDWAAVTFGRLDRNDPTTWRAERLEYAVQVEGAAPDHSRLALDAHPGLYGDFDWYSFDEASRLAPTNGQDPDELATASVLPTPVRFAGMPDPRWWSFEDARFNWSDVDADRRDLARLVVIDFMLVQGTDWFVVPVGHAVGEVVAVHQLLVRDVFGGYTLVRRADAAPGAIADWTMFSTKLSSSDGVADYFILPPSGLRATVDGPIVEEVRFVRDEQANLVWAVETTTEDGTARPWLGRERAAGDSSGDSADSPSDATPSDASLRYQLQTTVPVNWIPFIPVQTDAARRAVALQRAAMQHQVNGALVAVRPVGRVLNPTSVPATTQYRIREEEIPRTGIRVLRGAHRSRWVDGSTHVWTARRRRVGMGEATSGLRYDLLERESG